MENLLFLIGVVACPLGMGLMAGVAWMAGKAALSDDGTSRTRVKGAPVTEGADRAQHESAGRPTGGDG